MLALTEVPEGSRVAVVDLLVRGWGIRRRLMEMGLSPGSIVEVVNNTHGPVVVRVRGVVVAIGRGVASRILVRLLEVGENA